MRHYRALPRVFISCNFTARAKRSDDLSCTPIHLVDHLPSHFSPPSDFRDFRLKKTKRKNFKIRTCLNRCWKINPRNSSFGGIKSWIENKVRFIYVPPPFIIYSNSDRSKFCRGILFVVVNFRAPIYNLPLRRWFLPSVTWQLIPYTCYIRVYMLFWEVEVSHVRSWRSTSFEMIIGGGGGKGPIKACLLQNLRLLTLI